jgi:hypothetical protein
MLILLLCACTHALPRFNVATNDDGPRHFHNETQGEPGTKDHQHHALPPLPRNGTGAGHQGNETHGHIFESCVTILWIISTISTIKSVSFLVQQLNTFQFYFLFFFLFLHYSALLHLPPLRFHCADGCWDRTQDRCNLCIGSQTL